MFENDIRQATQKDEVLCKVIKCLQSDHWPNEKKKGGELYSFYVRRNELSIEEGIILWGLRVVIPHILQKKILAELHSEHPGIVRMKALSRVHVWFHKIDECIENLVSECPQCQSVANAPSIAPPRPWAPPSGPMDRVHVDYFGPFLQKHWLLMVDAYSGWPEVCVVPRADTENTISVLRNWFAKYGLPNQIVSDNGSQFVAKEFENFCNMNGIKHITSAPYHQSSNGEAERLVQTVKKGLKRSNAQKHDFQKKLDNVLIQKYAVTEYQICAIRVIHWAKIKIEVRSASTFSRK